MRLDDLPPRYRAQARKKLAQVGGKNIGAIRSAGRKGASAKEASRKGCPQSVPHAKLWDGLRDLPDAHLEYPLGIAERRFRADIAFPLSRLSVEVDGWQHHGKRLSDFTRDRERQNLMTIHGWRILRFTAGQIHDSISKCRMQVEAALKATHAGATQKS